MVDPSIVEDQTNGGGGGSDAENRGENDDPPMPKSVTSPAALPFDLQHVYGAIKLITQCKYPVLHAYYIYNVPAGCCYLEDGHAREREGERDEREGADEVDEVPHEREQRGDEDVEAEDEPPRAEASREVVPGEHALVQPLQPRVHRLVDRHREQLRNTSTGTGLFVSYRRRTYVKLKKLSCVRTCWETMLCRKAVALMSTAAHLGPPSSLGRYSDTADPYAQYPATLMP